MKILSEFHKFVMRGSLVDLAIGFTVGAAFTSVAKSLVNDIIMPPLGLVLGQADFKEHFVVLREGLSQAGPYETLAEAQAAGATILNYGAFVNNCLALFIVAVAMFVTIHMVNKAEDKLEALMDEPEDPAQPQPKLNKKCPYCFTTIDIKATRCPNCTSHIELKEGQGGSAKNPA